MKSQDVMAAEQAFPERPVEAYKAWLEMIHRYFAGTLGLVVFALAYLLGKHQPSMRNLGIGMSVLIVAQAALGMWTVTLKLMPVIVMLHLLGGFTLFCLLALTFCRLRFANAEPKLLPMRLCIILEALRPSQLWSWYYRFCSADGLLPTMPP